MSDAFISYSRENSDFIKRVVDELINAGLSVWVDWKDIPISADWLKDIFLGIENADNVLFFISSDSITSPICHLELAHARECHKRIIPVVYEEVEIEPSLASFASRPIDSIVFETLGNADVMRVASENYLVIKRHNWLMMTDEAQFEYQIGLLLEAIKADLPYKRLSTHFLARARIWEEKERAAGYLLTRTEIQEALSWLAQGEQKSDDSRPSRLQHEYIVTSKKFLRMQRGRLGAAVSLLSIIALAIGIGSVFAFGLLPEPAKPLPKMTNAVNIAIADFAMVDQADGQPHPDSNGTALAAVMGTQLKSRLPEDLQNLIAIEAGNLRTIFGSSEDEQRAAARRLANEMDAHIVIYGTIDNTGNPAQYQISYYVAQGLSDAEELTGINTFGFPVEIELPIVSAENRDADGTNSVLLHTDPTFIDQMNALSYFMIGLALVKEDQNQQALTWLDRARDVNIGAQDNDGEEILDYWTAVALLSFEEDVACPIQVPADPFPGDDETIEYAEEGSLTTPFLCAQAYFLKAIESNPDYVRAVMGLANAYGDAAEYAVAGRHVVRCDLYLTAIEFYNDALVRLSLSDAFDNIELIRMKTYYNIGLALTSIRYAPSCGQDDPDVVKDANDALNRAIELYPTVLEVNPEAHKIAAQAYYQRGLIQAIEGNAENAAESFDEVISITSGAEYREDWYMLKYAAIHQRGLIRLDASAIDPAAIEDAIADFTTVIEAYPDQFGDLAIVSEALFDRAMGYELLEQDEAALADYCSLIDLEISPRLRFEVTSRIDETACL